METLLLILSLLLSTIILIVLFIKFKNNSKNHDNEQINFKLDQIEKQIIRNENTIKNEITQNRTESSQNNRENREEMINTLKGFNDSVSKTITDISVLQKNQLDVFSTRLDILNKSNDEKNEKLLTMLSENLQLFSNIINQNSKTSRDELSTTLKSFEETLSKNIKEWNETQRLRHDLMSNTLLETSKTVELRLEKMRETLEQNLNRLQEENSKKLDEMRATVDEKLQNTLDKRLSESFKQVSERLELVHKGLGEMQNLAIGVGDLKKVLSNVKTRGILGEMQLSAILDQILTPEQFATNVVTKPGSREMVEFAIKLPGKDDAGTSVYLPVDAKFPIEDYNALIDAYDTGNPEKIELTAKNLEASIKRAAKDIRDKYIEPPYTTDFGIMFLPFEGLFAEVVRRSSLLETLQREYKIIITGPTTLAAILNSLQMGFKTLAIEKRSSEVWKILGAVKTEFGKFGEVLKKAQDKILKANEDIEELVGTRTRKIQSKLKNIQELPASEIPNELKEPDEID